MKKENESGAFLKKYPGVRVGVIIMLLILIAGVSSAFTIEKEIQVNYDGKVYTAKGKLLESLGEVLAANGLPASEEYKYNEALDTLFKDVIEVDIEKKLTGKIRVDGETISYATAAVTVSEALEENGVEIGRDDKVVPERDTPLNEKTSDIKVIRVVYVESEEVRDIPMKANITENRVLPSGSRIVTQVGKNGKAEMKERICYEDGTEIGREVISSKVIEPSVDEVIEVGPDTKVVLPQDVEVLSVEGDFSVEKSGGVIRTSAKEEASSGSGGMRSMVVSATAYTATGNNTACGLPPQAGRTIATWGDIPFGTQVYIPILGGVYTVEDRGGAVTYGIIDIYMDTEEECINWGRQNIEIYFID